MNHPDDFNYPIPLLEDIKVLCEAAKAGDDAAVIAFLDKFGPASVNTPELWGWTALMWASMNDRRSTVELLLERGASPDIRDYIGRTAHEIALFYNNVEVAEMIERWPETQRRRQEEKERALAAQKKAEAEAKDSAALVEVRQQKLKGQKPSKGILKKTPPKI